MYNVKKAFTLIELMVVVAVIAILATLGVSNFSAAIKRTRNAGRQADMQAVAKALETCYDVGTGKYTSMGTATVNLDKTSTPLGAFKAGTNACLNQDIRPSVSGYQYNIAVDINLPQKWVVCAKLEPVANVKNLCNHFATTPLGNPNNNFTPMGSFDELKDTCWYCIKNQQ